MAFDNKPPLVKNLVLPKKTLDLPDVAKLLRITIFYYVFIMY